MLAKQLTTSAELRTRVDVSLGGCSGSNGARGCRPHALVAVLLNCAKQWLVLVSQKQCKLYKAVSKQVTAYSNKLAWLLHLHSKDARPL